MHSILWLHHGKTSGWVQNESGRDIVCLLIQLDIPLLQRLLGFGNCRKPRKYPAAKVVEMMVSAVMDKGREYLVEWSGALIETFQSSLLHAAPDPPNSRPFPTNVHRYIRSHRGDYCR
jgi:hypothetical protein